MTKARPKIDIDEVRAFIKTQPRDSKIYIGCDSNLKKKRGMWYADYVTVIVVHMADPNIPGRFIGGKIFGEVESEPDYTVKLDKPNMRLLNEVMKTAVLFDKIQDVIGGRQVEIHLDINTDPAHASNQVAQQAIGYIRGVCGLEPKIKPEAFAASYCADRFMRVDNYDITGINKVKGFGYITRKKAKKKKAS